MFAVDESQLSRHFTIYEERGKAYVTARVASEASTSSAPVASDELRGLEHRLQQL
eukprot:CAMPEP_0180790928 /NCGR_PEP_ID=MMETSP1038_2-20121128/53522_1 /TAXON_ID=632150 /ORGANISM="Azadinium spinosum, Strain 3D9" /LENGTH=54 /DNA_ID=CAMNT_0022829003 /DNA_START=21 /DNA_END=182 /DNA_ORIENTATION=+